MADMVEEGTIVEPVEAVDVVEVEVVTVVVPPIEEATTTDVVEVGLVTLAFFWYSCNPFGPPQTKLALPEHVMVHLPSVAGMLPTPRVLPQ